MKRVLALTGVLALIMPTVTYAATSSVSIQNTVDSSSNSDTTTTSESNVRIETNGEVKEFNTTGDESVDWTSPDGKSSVKINNNGTKVVQGAEESKEANEPEVSKVASPTPEDQDEASDSANSNKPEKKVDFDIPLTPVSMLVTLVKSLFSLL